MKMALDTQQVYARRGVLAAQEVFAGSLVGCVIFAKKLRCDEAYISDEHPNTDHPAVPSTVPNERLLLPQGHIYADVIIADSITVQGKLVVHDIYCSRPGLVIAKPVVSLSRLAPLRPPRESDVGANTTPAVETIVSTSRSVGSEAGDNFEVVMTPTSSEISDFHKELRSSRTSNADRDAATIHALTKTSPDSAKGLEASTSSASLKDVTADSIYWINKVKNVCETKNENIRLPRLRMECEYIAGEISCLLASITEREKAQNALVNRPIVQYAMSLVPLLKKERAVDHCAARAQALTDIIVSICHAAGHPDEASDLAYSHCKDKPGPILECKEMLKPDRAHPCRPLIEGEGNFHITSCGIELVAYPLTKDCPQNRSELNAYCSDLAGRLKESTLDLNVVLANEDGKFKWIAPGQDVRGNYSHSARNNRLDFGGPSLFAELQKCDGSWVEDSANLSRHIENVDGVLTFKP